MQRLIVDRLFQYFNGLLVLWGYLIKKEECFQNAGYGRADMDHLPQACTTNHHLEAPLMKNLG